MHELKLKHPPGGGHRHNLYRPTNLAGATFPSSALSGDLFTVMKSLAQRPNQTETRKLRGEVVDRPLKWQSALLVCRCAGATTRM